MRNFNKIEIQKFSREERGRINPALTPAVQVRISYKPYLEK